MAAYDDLNAKRIFVVGIASVVVTAVTALAVQVLYYSMAQRQKLDTQAASSFGRQKAVLEQQLEQISNYGVDENTGNIVIPVEKAIETMVADYSENDAESEADSGETQNDKESREET
jgi:hypothetical protein